MSTLNVRRLSMILRERSAAWVSRQTGIPQSTLSYVRRGLRPLPQKYVAPLRNTYQREAYARLRAQGAPTHQARRFSWVTPERAQTAIDTLNIKRGELTMGYVQKLIAIDDLDMSDETILELWPEAEDAILEGMQNSLESLETIYDY